MGIRGVAPDLDLTSHVQPLFVHVLDSDVRSPDVVGDRTMESLGHDHAGQGLANALTQLRLMLDEVLVDSSPFTKSD